jgi:chromosomal replication initiation ATPase DnaA
MCIIDVRKMPVVLEEISRAQAKIQSLTGVQVKLVIASDLVTISTDEAHVLDVICAAYNIDYTVLQTKRRKQNMVFARGTYAYIMRKYYGQSWAQIASIFKQDHTTMISIVKRIEGFKTVNDKVWLSIQEIINTLFNNNEAA